MTEVVFFSDIHGNIDALEKLLYKEMDKSNRLFVFCGDIIGYYYHAEECVNLLKSMDNLIVVRGNHDQYYVDSFSDLDLTERLVNRYGSSYREKSGVLYDFIHDMPERTEMKISNKRVVIQHGSLADPINGRVYPNTELEDLEAGVIYIAGHTHYQMLRSEKNALWINPGSLGQPRDGKGFSYCVMDECFNISFRSVQIDIAPMVQEIRRKDPKNKYLEEVLYRNI